jgi:N-acetylgalactosamine-N,N'-diacetylbacillosaminyl-diphospho-undecaprenol 4-alpha-N-acetylgalactosaminyltransferase
MSKKKIAILCVSMKGGGAERVISTILNNLYTDFDFYLVLLDKDIEYLLPSEVRVIVLKTFLNTKNSTLNVLQIPFLARQFYKLCTKEQIDISLSFLSRPNLINCCLKFYPWVGKTLISERTATVTYYKSRGYLSKNLGLALIKYLYPKADVIIPNSEGVQKELESILPVTAYYNFIYNPLDIQKIHALSKESIQINDLSKENLHKVMELSFSFIYVARFHKDKNHIELIRAFSSIQKDINFTLILLGVGECLEKCKKEVILLGLEKKVLFLGFDNNPYKYLAKADCFVCPSKYEGFPNVLIEAMSCGLPVISTDCPCGPREIIAPHTELAFQLKTGIEYAEHGILVPVGNVASMSNAMLEVYQNDILRAKYARQSILRSSDFNIKVFIARFTSVLEMIN